MNVEVPESSQKLPPMQDVTKPYTPYINYTKLLFKVLKLLQTLFLGCELLNGFIEKYISFSIFSIFNSWKKRVIDDSL